MKPLSQTQALARLKTLKDDFKSEISNSYEHRAKSCLTCETQGACCLDAHFVNVHISRLEAVAINEVIQGFPAEKQAAIGARVNDAIERYSLNDEGDTFARTFACPLFEKGMGCLVHDTGKPLACITHACYENKADLPPDNLLVERENMVDQLNAQTYCHPQPWLPLPVAIRRYAT